MAVVVGAFLVGAAFFAGRLSRTNPKDEKKQPAVAGQTSQAQASSSTKDASTATAHTHAEAEEISRIERLRTDLRRNPSGSVERLNELQALLNTALKNGSLSSMGIVGMYKEETDQSILDVLQGVLAANPDYANAAGVTETFTEMARTDQNASRRQTAIAYLGTAWDKDGKVKDTLIEIARNGKDIGLRMCALGTLKAYLVKNWTQTEAVTTQLLSVAQNDKNEDVRAQALYSMEIHTGGEKAAMSVLGFLQDSQPVVRLATAEKLGDAAPTARPAVVNALEQAIAQEKESHVKKIMLANLVKAGRSEAASALERVATTNTELKADAQDYLSILKGGYTDWTDITRLKGDMEESRGH